MARKSRRNNETAELWPVKQKLRVGAYIRLSAVDRKHKGDSIENQKAIIIAYIAEHVELELTETYIDDGLSGQTLERPSFQRMIADMEIGKINCCITKDLSRLGRNAIDMGYYIEKYFPSRNIRYIAVNDDYDSADIHSVGIAVGLKNMVNEAYALDIGRKIRATKQMNIRGGCFVGRLPPYGFLKSNEDNHKLVPDPNTAPIVREIFERAANGDGVAAILNWLNNNGILPPKRYMRSIGLATEKEANVSVHWNRSVIYALLKNRVYTGDMVQGKSKTNQNVQNKLPPSEWVLTENTHEPLVSRELFEKIQNMRENGSFHGKTFDELRRANPLLRKVFCGHCGHAMFRCKGKGKAYTFSCRTRQVYGAGDCIPNSISDAELKNALLKILHCQAEVFTDSTPPKIAKSAADTELRNVQAELERNSHFLKGLYESLVSGDITDAEYKEMKQSYGEKIAALSARERQLRETSLLTTLESAKRSKTALNISTAKRAANLTPELVDNLVDKILVFEGKRMEIRLKFTDEIFTIGGADNE